jgi:hypothetical protein
MALRLCIGQSESKGRRAIGIGAISITNSPKSGGYSNIRIFPSKKNKNSQAKDLQDKVEDGGQVEEKREEME